jgi:hypothetical protein
VSFAEDDNVVKDAQRVADSFLNETSHSVLSLNNPDLATADPEAAADEVTEHWIQAPKSFILACVYFVAAWNAFEGDPEKLDVFLARLAYRRVLSQDDILTRWKSNGKVAMLRKIGRHADSLLMPSILPLLPAHYSILYQICLLIEEVGPDRAERELSTRPGATRDDVIKVRSALRPDDTENQTIPATPALGETGVQVFALRPSARDWRFFANDYVHPNTLDHCLNRPQTADNAGLVAIVPILMLGTFERALMPLLGFGALDKLFLQSRVESPEITDRDVIVVARRGNFRPQPLTDFPAEVGHRDVLTLADLFFPNTTVKSQLFAQQRADGWTTLIGDENWNERPSVR